MALRPSLPRAGVSDSYAYYRKQRDPAFSNPVSTDLEKKWEGSHDPAAPGSLHVPDARFHELVDAVTDFAIFLLDADGRVATWSSGAKRAKGYESNEIVGRHFSVFYTPEDRAAGLPERILDEVRRTGRYEQEGFRVRKDGSLFWANVVITSLRDAEGRVTGFAKVTRDLTERREAQSALRAAEERFRLLVEGVTDYAIYMLDPDGRVTTWNLGAKRMTGYSREEIIGRDFAIFFTQGDCAAGKPAEELRTAREQGRSEDENWRRRKDGSLFWANVIVAPLRDAGGQLVGYAKITRDLTQRKAAEANERRLLAETIARTAAEESERRVRQGEELAQREAARAQLEARRAAQATRAKDEFLATISHELRTPLNAVLGYASILKSTTEGRAEPQVAKAIETIFRNAQAQARLVDDILDMSRIVTGKMQIDPQPFALFELVEEALDVVRPSATAKSIAIDFRHPSASLVLVADRERLRQVLWNLLSNAVKFTGRNGHVSLTIEHDASTVSLRVTDDGRGIEPALLSRVFERFLQGEDSPSRRSSGLGLGLAIVRHIVELHGGNVQAMSEGVGRGSTFVVTLPLRVAPAEDPAPARSEEGADHRSREHLPLTDARILAFVGSPLSRDRWNDALTASGATVFLSSVADEALDLVRTKHPQLVLCEATSLTDADRAFIRRLRALRVEQGGRTPTLLLASDPSAEMFAQALGAGFSSILPTPVTDSDLTRAVAGMLASFRT